MPQFTYCHVPEPCQYRCSNAIAENSISSEEEDHYDRNIPSGALEVAKVRSIQSSPEQLPAQPYAAVRTMYNMNMPTVDAHATSWLRSNSTPSTDGYADSPQNEEAEHFETTGSRATSSSITDTPDSDHEWVTSSSQETLCCAFPERLHSCHSDQGSVTPRLRNCEKTYLQLKESISSGGILDELAYDETTPDREDQEDDSLDKLQEKLHNERRIEFESHPGHKFWEWDKVKLRWKRRGTKDEWLPDFFA